MGLQIFTSWDGVCKRWVLAGLHKCVWWMNPCRYKVGGGGLWSLSLWEISDFLSLNTSPFLLLSSALALSEISPGFEVSQSIKDDPNLSLWFPAVTSLMLISVVHTSLSCYSSFLRRKLVLKFTWTCKGTDWTSRESPNWQLGACPLPSLPGTTAPLPPIFLGLLEQLRLQPHGLHCSERTCR